MEDTADAQPAAGAEGEGVRERRNRELRQRVHLAALDLGERFGIGAVTVAQIATASGISRRSFFRHFGSKEEAVLAGHSRYLDAVASLPLEVDTAAGALGAIERLGDVVLELEGIPDLVEHRRVAALIAADPAIRAYAVAQDRVIADMLRDRLAEQLPQEELGALELVADLGVTIWRHGWVRWSAQAGSADDETPAQSHAAARRLFRELAGQATPG
ncbi:TetR family transcriptional regulator [Leucobacter komagatae]|uniref:TetR family transcriptional regulator n=1 Tax=Leucobacter komagatae TaxID=55969 RepID=A0A542Y363_9MICO|nr:TetR/AcrR family transcriptional regulator [Leucobacter komagatae]TQL42516.1 TetR family transcriptional regulator [Leucobacter komagatae]